MDVDFNDYSCNTIEHQEWSYRLSEEEPAEFQYVFRQYNQMVNQIEILIRQVYEKQVQTEQARRKQLQAQINPHFLYNSFYMGYRMAKSGESDRVANLCMYLGDYFKIMTYAADNWITVEQELKFTEIYLKLNEMRFAEKMEYKIIADEKTKKYQILPLMIQPLVENAIVHSVEVSKGKTVLNINGYIEQGNVMIEIKDDGVGMDRDTLLHLLDPPEGEEKDISVAHTGLGMYAVHQRLRYLYGEEYGLTADSEPGNGTCIKICIPFTKGEEKTWS